jgi:hypothetical protein
MDFTRNPPERVGELGNGWKNTNQVYDFEEKKLVAGVRNSFWRYRPTWRSGWSHEPAEALAA